MFEIEIIKCVKYWQENTERTVNEISSDPPSEDGYVRFTMVPLKPLSDQWGGKYFSKSIKLIISMRFSCSRKAQVTLLKNSQLKIIGFHIYKHWYLIHTYQTKGYRCESSIANCAWRVTWNYAYNPFKENNEDNNGLEK